jgi:hypothetical protein
MEPGQSISREFNSISCYVTLCYINMVCYVTKSFVAQLQLYRDDLHTFISSDAISVLMNCINCYELFYIDVYALLRSDSSLRLLEVHDTERGNGTPVRNHVKANIYRGSASRIKAGQHFVSDNHPPQASHGTAYASWWGGLRAN